MHGLRAKLNLFQSKDHSIIIPNIPAIMWKQFPLFAMGAAVILGNVHKWPPGDITFVVYGQYWRYGLLCVLHKSIMFAVLLYMPFLCPTL